VGVGGDMMPSEGGCIAIVAMLVLVGFGVGALVVWLLMR
jgi:hypothetical protein